MENSDALITDGQKLQAFLKGIADGITVINGRMEIVWANPVVEGWVGGLEEIMGSYCYRAVAGRYYICRGCPAVKAFRTGTVEKRDIPFYIKGNKRHFGLTASPVFDESGKVVAVAEFFRDLTEKVDLEARLNEDRDRVRAIFDGISDGISIIDRAYHIRRVNRGLLNLFNKRDFQDVLGKKCYAEYYREDKACDNCPARRTFEQGIPGRATSVCRGTRSEKNVIDISTFPIRDGNNRVVQVIEYFRNITGMVKLEDQLLRSERMAGIGELATGIAHELRNPLGNISASVQFCLSRFDLQEEIKRHLRVILRNSKNANRIVKDLLDFAKPGDVTLKPGNIQTVIDRACALVKSRCLKQRVRLHKMPGVRLPRVLVDEKRLEGAFLNFIMNSLDSMPEGGSLTITTRLDNYEGEVVTSFKDTGCGIPADNLDKVFAPFFTTKKDGIGLGLSIAHSVIAHHGGRIEIKSERGRGTELTVRFTAPDSKGPEKVQDEDGFDPDC